MMTVIQILQSNLSIEEAKMAIYRLSFSEGDPGVVELNQVFYPTVARATINLKITALEVIQKHFKPFDLHAQKREAEILNEYLIQLGSK